MRLGLALVRLRWLKEDKVRGLRKLLVIGVTLGLYSSVVAPAHANTVITYQLLPDLQGISEVDIRVNFALHIYTTFPGDENFSIAGDGLNQFIGQGNYDVFMHELDISPPYTGGLLFELRSAQEGTDYVYVHTVGSEGGCTDGLCTVIDFLAGAFSVSQFPHDPAIQIVFTNDTGGLQEIVAGHGRRYAARVETGVLFPILPRSTTNPVAT